MSTMCPDVLADDQPPLAEPPKPIDGPEAKKPVAANEPPPPLTLFEEDNYFDYEI